MEHYQGNSFLSFTALNKDHAKYINAKLPNVWMVYLSPVTD